MFRKGLKNSSILFSDSSSDLYGKNSKEHLLSIAFGEIRVDEENVKKVSEWMYDENQIGVFFIYGCNDETLTERIISLEKESGEVIWYSPIRELPEDTFYFEGADPTCTYLSSAVINHKILKKDCTDYIVRVQGYNTLEMKLKAIFNGEQKEEDIKSTSKVEESDINEVKEEIRSNESMQDLNDVSKLKEKFHREIDEKFRTGSIFKNEETPNINSLKRKELEDEIENNILNENILDEDMLGDDLLDDDLLTSDLLNDDMLVDDMLSDDMLSDDMLSEDMLSEDILSENRVHDNLLENDLLGKDIEEMDIDDSLDINNSGILKDELFNEDLLKKDDVLINDQMKLHHEELIRTSRQEPIEHNSEPRIMKERVMDRGMDRTMSATDMMVNNLMKDRLMKEHQAKMANQERKIEKTVEPIGNDDDFMENFQRSFNKDLNIAPKKEDFDLNFTREEKIKKIEKIQEFTDTSKYVNQFNQKQTVVNEFLNMYPVSITVNKAKDKSIIRIDDNIIVEKVGHYYITIINGLAFKPIYLLEGEKQYFEFREGAQGFFEKVKTLVCRMYGLELKEFDNLKKLLIVDSETDVNVPNLRIMSREESIDLLESTRLNVLDLSERSLFISLRDENDLKTTIRYRGNKVNQNPEIIEKVERINEMYDDIKMLGYSSIKNSSITSVARLLIDNLK